MMKGLGEKRVSRAETTVITKPKWRNLRVSVMPATAKR